MRDSGSGRDDLPSRITRRRFLGLAAGAGGALASPAVGSGAPPSKDAMRTRPVPSSGEAVPVVGLGTWQTFDVGDDEGARARLREVLRRFFGAGAKLVDSSPMYGTSEAVVGGLLRGTPWARQALVATKVWTSGREAGETQMAESEQRMGGRLDLVQVHNLLDWKTHLPTLRAWKAARRIRYVGITHYSLSAFEEMEAILRRERVDFVQLPYSVGVREAEKRLLPAARDAGTAVIVMRPFEGGSLFREAQRRPLPPFAGEFGARTWAQVFLKFILAHPAVTAAIPATGNPDHVADDLEAGRGELPDESLRRKLVAYLSA